MPVKRRNGGRSKKNRGNTKNVTCSNCARQVPKDKAIKRYTVRDMIDASSKRDIREKLALPSITIPKLYNKLAYCVSCAIHARIVRVRSVEDRKIRTPPKRIRRDAEGKIKTAGTGAKAEVAK